MPSDRFAKLSGVIAARKIAAECATIIAILCKCGNSHMALATGVTTLTIDLDDTLWAVKPVILRAEQAMRDHLFEHYPATRAHLNDSALHAIRRSVVSANPNLTHDLTFLRKQCLRELASMAGYEDALAESAFAVFDEQRNRVELYDGVLDALGVLAQTYKLIALTNGNASLRKTGVAKFFSAKVNEASAGAAKPDPAIFRHSLQMAGIEPSQAAHIGDDPTLDAKGAIDCGLQAIWVNPNKSAWPHPAVRAPLQVTRFEQIPALLGLS